MSNKSEKYGTYYGELSIPNDDFSYHDWDPQETILFMIKLLNCGVTEVLLDVELTDNCSDTMFFETTETTNFKDLMLIITNERPHEFTEETPNHFRMWFD
jgi:hypothetical protein